MKVMSASPNLGAVFESISPAEFFYRNRQMAGFGNPSQAVYSTVRELVENSLDACEDALCSPKIQIHIASDRPKTLTVTVTDNGPGLPYTEVPQAFGKVLYGSKYDQRQRRGTFGLGVTMAVLYGQITTDSLVEIETQTDEKPGRVFRLLVDVEQNEPFVECEDRIQRSSNGTTVSICLKGDLKRAQDRIIDYLRLTTIGTPHARIEYKSDDEKFVVGPWTSELPPLTRPSKPHPRAVDMELLRRLISISEDKTLHSFLVDSFQQIGIRTASKFLALLGHTNKTRISALSRQELARLSNAMRSYAGFGKPDSTCLSPIGEAPFMKGVASIFNTSFQRYIRSGIFEWEGNPILLEGVLAIGDSFPSADIPTLFRFANRVPLLYDANEDALTKATRKIRWSRYGVSKPQPIALFLNLSSTRIPYKAAGKQSIASTMEIENEALSLLRALGRGLGKSLGAGKAAVRFAKKKREFSEMIGIVAKYGSALADHEKIPSTGPIVKKLFDVVNHD